VFVVMIVATQDNEAEPVGPFQNSDWANRYVEYVRHRFYEVRVEMLLSPTIVDPDRGVIFDPSDEIDRLKGS
jgi:hypothetical protein